MNKQLLFYENVAPISLSRHKSWSLEQGQDYSFAARANAVPVMCSEFQAASLDLPVVFGKSDTAYAPIAMLGIEKEKSLLIGDDGTWKGGYVPAFIRRFPFVFAEADDKQTYTLCIDEDYAGLDKDGKKGNRFFDDEDKPTGFMNRALEFMKKFEVEGRRTREFCKLLAEKELFDPMQAAIRLSDGEQRNVTGFHVISRERLKALDADTVAEFFKRDVLELVYLHLASLRNMERLREFAL